MASLLIFSAFALIGLFVTATTLFLIGKWLRFKRRSFLLASAVSGVWMVAGIAAVLIQASLPPSAGRGIFISLAMLAGLALVEIAALYVIMRPTPARTFAAWSISLGVRGVVIGALGLLILRPFFIEAYTYPTQSMIPTILCDSTQLVCPRCGGVVYIMAAPPLALPYEFEEVSGTCMQCRQDLTAKRSTLQLNIPADRFTVCRIAKPSRWDIVAYNHHSTDHGMPVTDIYVKRIVGLPGERVSIDAGGIIFIDASAFAPPSGVPTRFRWPEEYLMQQAKLKPGESVTLGQDEYFVLGDLGEHSSDSRFHGPIKGADITGVVDLIYAPFSRMRILR